MKLMRLDHIIDACCAELDIERADLCGPSRHKRVVLAREAYTHLAKSLTVHSYPDIGAAIGKHHTSIIAAHQRMTDKLSAGASFGADDGGEPVSVASVVRAIHGRVTGGKKESAA